MACDSAMGGFASCLWPPAPHLGSEDEESPQTTQPVRNHMESYTPSLRPQRTTPLKQPVNSTISEHLMEVRPRAGLPHLGTAGIWGQMILCGGLSLCTEGY